MDLVPKASAGGRRFTNLVRLSEVDSTNSYLVRALGEGAEEGLVVVADAQQRGRGRLGRQWFAPPNSSLLCSIAFRPRLSVEQFHLVSTAVALSACEAVASTTGVAARIKWPNDLVVSGRKLAGLLAELVTDPSGVEAPGLVVGIGVNLAWPTGWPPTDAPPEVAALALHATTLVAESGVSLGRDELLEALLVALESDYRALDTPLGRRQTMQSYRRLSATIGQQVRVSEVDRVWEGTAIEIDDKGSLVVERAGQRHSIEAGDVVHLTQLGAVEH